MIVYYKKESKLTEYLKTIREDVTFYKNGFLEKIGLKVRQYPDIYFHSGTLNSFTKTMIENSQNIIVNSEILKNDIVQTTLVKPEKIHVIFPCVEIKKFKKKDVKKPFYEKHNIDEEKKIIYFTAKNFQKAGFAKFCKIVENLEMENFQVVITVNIDKELAYAKDVLKHHRMLESTIILEEEVFDVADIFILPTSFKNFSMVSLKAMANKCAVFLPRDNYGIDLLDVFAIMEDANDPNISYKTDMLLRIPKELKNIQKENYDNVKKYTFEYQQRRLQNILAKNSI
jgi:glycosyltransferase involved in cell wall biosynthesis